MLDKIEGQFRAAVTMANYRNPERFKELRRAGKPLWEFKEHDHRLYAIRKVKVVNGTNHVEITLLSGWVKDKERSKGKNSQESREIRSAQNLRQEYEEAIRKTGGQRK